MTRTEDRLTDALTAAARAIPEDTLRPLVAPPARRGGPPGSLRSRPLWASSSSSASRWRPGRGCPGHGRPAARPAPRPRCLATTWPRVTQGGAPVVRSTATGQITATVPVPKAANVGVFDVLASTRGGVFFVAAAAPGTGDSACTGSG